MNAKRFYLLVYSIGVFCFHLLHLTVNVSSWLSRLKYNTWLIHRNLSLLFFVHQQDNDYLTFNLSRRPSLNPSPDSDRQRTGNFGGSTPDLNLLDKLSMSTIPGHGISMESINQEIETLSGKEVSTGNTFIVGLGTFVGSAWSFVFFIPTTTKDFLSQMLSITFIFLS